MCHGKMQKHGWATQMHCLQKSCGGSHHCRSNEANSVLVTLSTHDQFQGWTTALGPGPLQIVKSWWVGHTKRCMYGTNGGLSQFCKTAEIPCVLMTFPIQTHTQRMSHPLGPAPWQNEPLGTQNFSGSNISWREGAKKRWWPQKLTPESKFWRLIWISKDEFNFKDT